MINLDRLDNAPSRRVGEGAMVILDKLQDHLDEPPEVAALTLGVAFVLLAERLGLEPSDAYTRVANVLRRAHPEAQEAFEAVRLFLRHEMKLP